MKLLKKLGASFASAAIAFSVALAPAGAAVGFTDIIGHWAEGYVVELAEAGVVSTQNADGSLRTSFRPNDSITRAEVAKMAIETFFAGSVEDLSATFADAANPTFGDAAGDAWYFPYVEIAAGLGIAGGYANGNFGPADPITRAAALKMILESGDIEDAPSPANPFTDVTEDWQQDYVTTAYNRCIVSGKSATRFDPNAVITRAEVAKLISLGADVASGMDVCADDEEMMEDEEAASDESEEEAEEEQAAAVSGASLEVSLSSTSPGFDGDDVVPTGGRNIPYLSLDLTANGNEDVEVTRITVSLSGLGDEDAIDVVKVFDGVEQRGSDKSFSSTTNQAEINLSFEPVMVEAGTTKTIDIVADTVTGETYEGDRHRFSIASSDDIEAEGASTGGTVAVTGSFDISGATMEIGSIAVGSLEFTSKAITDSSADIGEEDVLVGRFEISAGPSEDVLVRALTAEQKGTIDRDEIANLELRLTDGTVLAGPAELNDEDEVTFDLTGMADGGYILEDGDSRNFEIRADIVDGIGKNVYFDFDDIETDVLAKGLKYNFNVTTTGALGNSSDIVTVEGGDLNFSITSTARDISPDTNDVNFGVLSIVNAGEDIRIEELNLILTVDGGAADAIPAEALSKISDIRLVNADTGSTILGPETPTDAANIASGCTDNDADGFCDNASATESSTIKFTDDFELMTGESLSLNIMADVEEKLANGNKYSFALNVAKGSGGIETKGLVSDEDNAADIKPASNPETQDYTIAQATYEVTANALQSQTFVAKTKDVELWKGTFTANDARDIYVTTIVYAETDSAEDVVENFSIAVVRSDGTEVVQQEAVSPATDTITFGDMDEDGVNGILIAAGEEVQVVLRGDIASTIAGSPTANYTLDQSELVAEDDEGTSVTDSVDADVASGATFTLAQQGTLTVTLKSSDTADASIILGGTTGNYVGAFEFDADEENAQIDELTVLIGNVDTSAILTATAVDGTVGDAADVINDYQAIQKVGLFYEDGTAVKKTNGSDASTTSISANGLHFAKAKLNSLDLIIDRDTDEVLFVAVDTYEVDTTTTARSGMAFDVSLSFNEGSDDFDVKGYSSGADYSTVAAVGGGADIEVDDEALDLDADDDQDDTTGDPAVEATFAGNNHYIVNNTVTVTKPSQSSALATGEKDALKFTLASTGDGDTDLVMVKGNLSVSSSAVTLDAVALYRGSELVAKCTSDGTTAVAGAGDFYCLAGDTDGNGAIEDGTDESVDVSIASSGDTFTIKPNITGTAAENSLTVSIDINATNITDGGNTAVTSAANNDGIVWLDYGTNGTDGVELDWIDLGSGDESTSNIENTLSN